MADFVFYNFGYFLYLIRDHKCARLVVPKVRLFPHDNLLLCSESAITIEGPLPVGEKHGRLAIYLRDVAVSINKPAPATLGRRMGQSMDEPDFDWVPRLDHAYGGVKLHPEWDHLPAIDTVISLGGGYLRAVPDAHTCEQTAEWTLPDEARTQHRQRVTALTEYTLPSTDTVSLIFTDLRTRERVGKATLRLDPDEPPVFSHLAAEGDVEGGEEAKKRAVNLSHIQALFSVCASNGKEVILPERKYYPKPCEEPQADRTLPPLVSQLLRLHEGTVECSGEQECEPGEPGCFD